MALMARGNITRRGQTSWELRVYLGRVDGRSKYKTETVRGSRDEAERRLRRLLDEVDDGAHRSAKTLGELFEEWVGARGASWSPSTLAMTRGHVKNYLVPGLGDVKLAKLDARTIDIFYGKLAAGGIRRVELAPATIRRIHGVLHLALEQAVDWGLIPRNPAKKASPPPAPRAGLTPPDVLQVLALIERAERYNPALATFIRLAAAVGPRRGESVGLRMGDIDWDEGSIIFRRAVIQVSGQIIVKPYPKSKVSRRVAVDPVTLDALAGQLDRMKGVAAQAGTSLVEDPWVFSHRLRADAPPRPDAFTRAFNRLRDRMGLTVRLHDLRHHHATQMLTSGVDVRTVAGRLGHSTAVTTLSVYAGWVPQADREAARIAGGLLNAPGGDGGGRNGGPPPVG